MDQTAPKEPVPASTRDTVGDLALVVSGALAQINVLNEALLHATRAIMAARDGDVSGLGEQLGMLRECQSNVETRSQELWNDLEGVLRRFAGEPDG